MYSLSLSLSPLIIFLFLSQKKLSQHQVHQLLKTLFPTKSDSNVDTLVQYATSDDGNIDYIKLMQKVT